MLKGLCAKAGNINRVHIEIACGACLATETSNILVCGDEKNCPGRD